MAKFRTTISPIYDGLGIHAHSRYPKIYIRSLADGAVETLTADVETTNVGLLAVRVSRKLRQCAAHRAKVAPLPLPPPLIISGAIN